MTAVDVAAVRAPTSGFLAVLRVREARALLLAGLVSGLGDQLARVALSVAVLDRSGSVLLAAAVFAVAYVPWVVAGPLLAALADRRPARNVLVTSDLLRAAVFGLMLVPGVPLVALLGLLLVAELAAPAFDAARSTALPEVLEGDAYVTGSALMSAVHQTTLVVGVGVAGALLTVVGPSTALGLDVVSFLASALLLRRGLALRPAAGADVVRPLADLREGVRALFALPGVRRLVLAAWLTTGVAVLPEGLAVAYGRAQGATGWTTAALLVAEPAGATVASLLVARCVSPDRRQALCWPLLLAGSLPLLGMLAAPGMAGTATLLALSGLSGAGLLLVTTRVGRTVPAEVRGRVFGLAASGLMAAQGLALLLGGLLGDVLPLHQVVALAGLVGVTGVLVLASRDADSDTRGPVPA